MMDKPNTSDPMNPRINRDLNSLATQNRRDQPSLSQTIQTVSGKQPEKPEERFMAWTRFFSGHRRFTALAATVAVAMAMLVVPFSYDKVVGHDVTLTMSGDLNRDLVQSIAKEFSNALDAEGVNMTSTSDNGSVKYELQTLAKDGDAADIADAFARTLTERGITATATSTQVKERVSSNVYAMAYDNAIHISIDDKSPEELANEIATQFEAAGLDAEVSVIMEGDEQMMIEVRAMSDGSVPEGGEPQIVLTSGGEPLCGPWTPGGGGGEFENASCRIMIEESAATGSSSMIVEVGNKGETVRAKVENFESLSDDELAAQVQKLLAAQGVNASVSAQNGRISLFVSERDGAPTATQGSSATRDATWGELKSKDWNQKDQDN